MVFIRTQDKSGSCRHAHTVWTAEGDRCTWGAADAAGPAPAAA